MRYMNLFVSETNDIFTYADERDEFEIGDIVIVDFRNREKKGIIVGLSSEESFDFAVKPIKRKVQDLPSYGKKYIDLLLWVRSYYLSGYSQVFNFINTSKVKVSYISQYRLNLEYIPVTEKEKEISKYLKKKIVMREVFVEKKFSQEDIEAFKASGILIYEHVAKENVKKSQGKEELPNTFLIDENLEEIRDSQKVKLTEEQESVVGEIESERRKYFLIHGITGSGKTEIYLSLMKKSYARGKSSIFLVPEISLTPQIIKRFEQEFGDDLAVLHSKMTESEKNSEWNLIATGKKRVVLGVRSAIFAPLKDIEYIIMDEEHETTYKQDTNPRYNAKMVATKRAELENCKLVLGSATPSVESYYFAEKSIFKLFTLKNRFNNAKLPQVEIVDMRKNDSEFPFFSEKLLENMSEVLRRGEQVIILLNRKGYSTYVQCKVCGHVEECPHCSIKYSYYQRDNRLKCNYCGISHKFSGRCSSCGSDDLSHSGKGVERIAEELENIFKLKVLKVDSDLSREREFHKRMYEDFLSEKYKIMVGTQMITKGLHFPNVTLVGVISADMSLSFPDFRANERTFQLLTQVSGRAGRGEKAGKVIIQTFQPDLPLFNYVVNADYEGFYRREIEDRKLLFYPPFSKLINIGISSRDEVKLEEISKTIYNRVMDEKVEVYGPLKSLVYKVKDRYRNNIFIKGTREDINGYKGRLRTRLKEFEGEKDIRLAPDVDPINIV